MIEFLGETPLKKPLIFDTHAHYDDQSFDEDRDLILSSFTENGVLKAISCGCDLDSSKTALRLSEKYSSIYFAAGYHPECIENGVDLSKIEQLCSHKKCVAIGEIGLDYYWTQDNKAAQQELFISQICLAEKLNKPVIVHDRDAHEDSLKILKKYSPRGVLHSFSGSVEMAKEVLKLDMYIGVGGVITFKNARKLPEVVKILPDDKILLETDAPYLTPVPYRGKLNHSAMIYFTAKKISEIRETSTEHILNITYENAHRLFGL